jgi:hypothetical protein
MKTMKTMGALGEKKRMKAIGKKHYLNKGGLKVK